MSFFQKVCTTCEDKPCVAVCDEKIIQVLEDGSVCLDFSKKGCTYCEECAKVCEKGILVLGDEPILISVKITLNITKCLAWHGTICSTCADVCFDKAIKFLGMFRPEINYENCTNCGFCIGVCPVDSISAVAIEKEDI